MDDAMTPTIFCYLSFLVLSFFFLSWGYPQLSSNLLSITFLNFSMYIILLTASNPFIHIFVLENSILPLDVPDLQPNGELQH